MTAHGYFQQKLTAQPRTNTFRSRVPQLKTPHQTFVKKQVWNCVTTKFSIFFIIGCQAEYFEILWRCVNIDSTDNWRYSSSICSTQHQPIGITGRLLSEKLPQGTKIIFWRNFNYCITTFIQPRRDDDQRSRSRRFDNCCKRERLFSIDTTASF